MGALFTSVDGRPSRLMAALPGRLRSQFERRSLSFIPAQLVHTKPWRELGRLIVSQTGPRFLTKHEQGSFSIDRVIQAHDRWVAGKIRAEYRAVYAYEDGALQTFRRAKELGVRTIYELPIAYWETARALLAEEAERYPDWACTMQGNKDSEAKLARKTAELGLADAVVVPSQFVLRSLPDWARNEKRCFVVEYGADAPDASLVPRSGEGPLKVLFVGQLTQRKGLADLFAAMKLLNRRNVELIVMGSTVADLEFYKRECADFTYEPPRPRNEVLKLMASCDVFVLPSIVEGRALVQLEAISQGLPLIVTPNAGGEDLIIEGETGFVVPIRSPEAIAEKIAWFADNRKEIPRMRQAALKMAERKSWANYRKKIAGTVLEILEGKRGE